MLTEKLYHLFGHEEVSGFFSLDNKAGTFLMVLD